MTLAPTSDQNRRLLKSATNDSEGSSYFSAFAKIFYLLGKTLWLLVLLGLLFVATLVWIWLASFRAGWRFGAWLEDPQSQDQNKLSLNLIYSFIVGLFSPLALFANWSQKVITEKLQIQFPPEINLREIVEKQLAIKLPDNFPFLPASKVESQEALLPFRDSE